MSIILGQTKSELSRGIKLQFIRSLSERDSILIADSFITRWDNQNIKVSRKDDLIDLKDLKNEYGQTSPAGTRVKATKVWESDEYYVRYLAVHYYRNADDSLLLFDYNSTFYDIGLVGNYDEYFKIVKVQIEKLLRSIPPIETNRSL